MRLIDHNNDNTVLCFPSETQDNLSKQKIKYSEPLPINLINLICVCINPINNNSNISIMRLFDHNNDNNVHNFPTETQGNLSKKKIKYSEPSPIRPNRGKRAAELAKKSNYFRHPP